MAQSATQAFGASHVKRSDLFRHAVSYVSGWHRLGENEGDAKKYVAGPRGRGYSEECLAACAAWTREMPDSVLRRAIAGSRREGRRSLSAYEPHARGTPHLVANAFASGALHPRRAGQAATTTADRTEPGFSAGVALALVYPFVRGRTIGAKTIHSTNSPAQVQPPSGEGTGCMKRKPSIKSLETISLDEAGAYLEHAGGDELNAAYALAWDRNRLDGSLAAPDDAEVHHALFLMCRACGKLPPSFDQMRVELRRRVAA